MNLSGCMALKNGVALGYPFIESILSLLPACDEFVIIEGQSDDDTYAYLERLQAKYPERIRLFREPWPTGLKGGRSIGEMQSRAIEKCRGRWVYLLQADEIMPPQNLPYLQKLCSGGSLRAGMQRVSVATNPVAEQVAVAAPMAVDASSPAVATPEVLERKRGRTIRGHKLDLLALRGVETVAQRFVNSYYVDFMHVTNHFQTFYFDGYRWAIRLARNRRGLFSDEDGWQLNGVRRVPSGVARMPQPLVHVGYNFPVNTWRKKINHARLYPESLPYQEDARKAEEMLRDYERGVLPELPSRNILRLPQIIAPLIGQYEYHVREELFAMSLDEVATLRPE